MRAHATRTRRVRQRSTTFHQGAGIGISLFFILALMIGVAVVT